MKHLIVRLICLVCLVLVVFAKLGLVRSQAESVHEKLGNEFSKAVYPLLLEHCAKCHSGKLVEGDIDLGVFKNLASIKKAPKVWQKVLEVLETSQMPPKGEKQFSQTQSEKVRLWVRSFLKSEALANAGDPGRVVLRRLSNAEYTNVVRDVTGVNGLSPARQFPVDGAAGEGFTNVGDGLVMSPSLLTKYLDAGKSIAEHMVLLPDGIRFSEFTSRRDWTNQILDQIRSLYQVYTIPGSSPSLKLQGVPIERKDAGVIPMEKYVSQLLKEKHGQKINPSDGLSERYLQLLRSALNGTNPSPILDPIRKSWREASSDDANKLVQQISRWEQSLWKFNTVGHIGKIGGPKSWMEAVDPIQTKFEARFKVPVGKPDGYVSMYLIADDAGDGNENDFVVWENPRFVAPGKKEVSLKDVGFLADYLISKRESELSRTAEYLSAVDEYATQKDKEDFGKILMVKKLDPSVGKAWLNYLGLGSTGAVRIQNHFPVKGSKISGKDNVFAWNSKTPDGLPSLIANGTDEHLRIPGNLKPRGVVVHPSPKLNAVVGWQSPVSGKTKVLAKVAHAHPECGNGVTWAIVLNQNATKRVLAYGLAQGGNIPSIPPLMDLNVNQGDVISVVIGPRDGNHSCDLTAIDLEIFSDGKVWNLAKDIVADPHQGNPHQDGFGNKEVWHFYSEAVSGQEENFRVIPKGSLLEKWLSSKNKNERESIAGDLQKLFKTNGQKLNAPDAQLFEQITSLSGPLFSDLLHARFDSSSIKPIGKWGVVDGNFGTHPKGDFKVDQKDLCVKAPILTEIRIPSGFLEGYELVTSARLHEQSKNLGSVQLHIQPSPAEIGKGLMPGRLSVKNANGQWTSNNQQIDQTAPVIVGEGGTAQKLIHDAFEEFRSLFPAALCYSKIVPVDEVVTLMLYHREDDYLARLMLSDTQRAKLDRLWKELRFVSQDSLVLVDALEQIIQFATQDANPKVFEPLREPFYARANQFRKEMLESEPSQLDAVIKFAGGFWRKPLTKPEEAELVSLYQQLRKQELSHEASIRLVLARVLVSSSFLYKLEKQSPGTKAARLNDWELANRLSFFLWSSSPDARLAQLASEGKLQDSQVLVSEMLRMMTNEKTRRFATDFFCQWLHIKGFDEMNEKSESHFPAFAGLKSHMYEESILFFQELIQKNGTVLDVMDANFTYLNEPLAKHYGVPGILGMQWRRVDGVKQYGRGGILALSTTLATQSGASRTSPILRGNWISEVLLGEKLPRPPKGVPQLPEDEAKTSGLTVRQLIEKHSSDEKCAVCHKRIDAYGFSLEGFDAIGKRRDRDLGNRPIDVKAKTMDGAEFEGLEGLRDYLLSNRKDAIVRQFCRKLLGYALGRSVQLSDEPLLDDIQDALMKNDYRMSVAFEKIVTSKQFREIRGADFSEDN
ncbi:MAG: DUF1592 domain-containing protein [Gemmataceae bacterium]